MALGTQALGARTWAVVTWDAAISGPATVDDRRCSGRLPRAVEALRASAVSAPALDWAVAFPAPLHERTTGSGGNK